MADVIITEAEPNVVVSTPQEQTTVVSSQEQDAEAIITAADSNVVVVSPSEDITIITSEDQTVSTIESISVGPQGIPGPIAEVSTDISVTAAIPLGGNRVIAADSDGKAIYADCVTAFKTVLGISTGAVVAGHYVTVRPFGKMTEPSWSLDVSKDVFLGENGLIVQDVPMAGAIVKLGFVVDPQTIFITISQRIER